MPTLEWIRKDKVVNHHQQVPYKTLVPQYTFIAEHSDNIQEFDRCLPQYSWVSSVKKIDCLLWSKRQ